MLPQVCRSLEAERVAGHLRRAEVINAQQGRSEVMVTLVEVWTEVTILLPAGDRQEGQEFRAEMARADPLEDPAVAQVEARLGAAHPGAHQVARREARLEDPTEDTPAVPGAREDLGTQGDPGDRVDLEVEALVAAVGPEAGLAPTEASGRIQTSLLR